MRLLGVACVAVALPALLAGCGGRAAARPATGTAGPESRPARIVDAPSGAPEQMSAAPAVRLDHFDGGSGRPDVLIDEGAPRPPRERAGVSGGSEGGGRPGLYHDLKRGETLYSLSRTYRVPLRTLTQVNGITDARSIRAGTPIFIPGSGGAAGLRLPEAPALAWPLRGNVTARFGRRGKRSHHEGVDIDGVHGEEVVAAAGGTVIRAGAASGYGRMVVIDHGNGVSTLYAHASRLLVEEGDRVDQGDPIAEVGRSGNARGTHLHFEVRHNGRAVDPLPLLRQAAQASDGSR
jgi:LysM repeat protein